MACVNEKWPATTPVGVDSYDPDDLLSEPTNFHSNPGYMGTSTASSAIQAQPGGIYRTSGGHMPMARGGPARQRTPGKTIVPAGPGREPTSEGAPLVVSTGFPGR